MAEKMTVDLDSEGPFDMASHERTYAAFINGVKWSTIAIIVALIVIAFLVY